MFLTGHVWAANTEWRHFKYINSSLTSFWLCGHCCNLSGYNDACHLSYNLLWVEGQKVVSWE